ncbi:MAG: PAS domain S-box protein [Bradyrhizobium sp.]|uniref:PAS domain S-box protein n=1 Tax=Bradyrhizobium sp. TaxID=376 RepID=UPI0025BB4B36|nr:PAS domain S-box protein [Bradyrhizobium sp.]MBI5265567.1 PAS domain S-box protein [Bradyrhizobium sp.]
MKLATKLAVAMILLVAVTVAAVGWVSSRSLERALLPRVVDRIEAQSQLLATELESYVAGARGDIASFRSTALNSLIQAHLAGGRDPVEKTTEKTWHDRVATRLVAMVEAKPAYAAFRVIGLEDGAREIVRVDRSGSSGAVRVAPESELQQTSQQAFVTETGRMSLGEIYVSPLTLEQDRVQGAMPIIRIATPVFAPEGKAFGIIVVDVDMRAAFERVRASVQPGEQVYIVGRDGDYLVHPDRAREFSAHSGKTQWQNDFPYFAALVGTQQSIGEVIDDRDGRLAGAALASTLLAGKEWIGVIQAASNASFMAPALAIQQISVAVGLIAVLGAAVLAVLLARSLTRPIGQLTAAVDSVGRDDENPIPVDAAGETGVLARAFARMMEETRTKTAALEREILEHRMTEAARDHHARRERLFSAAVQSSADAIVTKSLDGTITGWNPAAERLFGYRADEAVGKSIHLIVPPERIAETQECLRRIANGERLEPHVTVRLRKDGSRVEISLSVSPIKNPSGQIIGASKIARDITESRRTERALQREIEERRRIFESSQDLILVLDSHGAVVQVSPSCQVILGHRPEEMIGHACIEFIQRDDIDMAREDLRAARRGMRSRASDTRFLHKDGHPVKLSWLGSWSEPVKRYFFVGRDMTESLLAQESLHQSEHLSRNIIETALEAFVQVDDSFRILNWNSQAEKIFGWPRSEALGKEAIELIVAESARETVRAELSRTVHDEAGEVLGRRLEITARRRNGKEFRAEASITALRRRDGMLFNGFFRDLTDKIAAEERIRHSEKMEALGQLTGGVAHDFNNILTVITGTIEILADAVAREPQLAAITRMIDEAAARGAELTQHLLAFARKQPLQPREIDVNHLIVDTAKLLRPTLGEQIQIESVFEAPTCVAIVDPNQLTTASLNLALNARDAMPDGGKLILEAGSAYLEGTYAATNDVRPGQYAVIAVSDTGSGIPPAMLDKVFDPFFTSKGPGKGTGLGLSMVYGFVKQSAGHIKIYSKPGHGTTIRMYLPAGQSAVGTEDDISPQAIEGGRETILIVEDDRLVREYVLTQLHSMGYVTLEAANAAEALEIVGGGKQFDLLFTDVIMPGAMNGRQLADEVKKIRPGLKVLYTSGYTEDAIIHHGRLDSGVLLLQKPYRKSDLARSIRKALDG